MELFDALISRPEEESSGSNTANAFHYQRNWAIGELLKCHLNDDEYIFLFEFHDDVLIAKVEDEKSFVEFAQVKTKSTKANWTAKRLSENSTYKDGTTKPSFLCKLCINKDKFSEFESKMRFITNHEFSFDVPDNHAPVSNINNKEREEIKENLSKCIKGFDDAWLDSLYLEKADLSLSDHENHLKGKLNDFFTTVIGDDHGISINTIYRLLSDDIQRKCKTSKKCYSDVDELLKTKGIQKSEINTLINTANRKQSEAWSMINPHLHEAGYSTASEAFKLRRNWDLFCIDILNYQNTELHKLNDLISEYIIECDAMPLLSELIDCIHKKVASNKDIDADIYDKEYLDAIILRNYCDQR